MYKQILKFLSLTVFLQTVAPGIASAAEGKVLYVTHLPGQWHDYQAQLDIFKDKVASGQDWEVTVLSDTYDGLLQKMHNPDFARGYDAVVYNYCVAETTDLESCANVIRQTREHGVPAMLIHCAMHSWWDTFKRGEKIEGHPSGIAMAVPARVEEWKAAHEDVPFPIYGDFTGVASVQHGPKVPITLHKTMSHPATARLPEGYTTPDAELYNNFYIVPEVVPLVEGTQQINARRTDQAVVMWTCPQGASRVLGLTLGHSTEEWSEEVFQHVVADSINYLLEHPKP